MTKHQERNAAHSDYVAWVHARPCAACGYRGEAIQAAHVGQGGTGMKHGDDDECIPLCGPRFPDEPVFGAMMLPGCHADHDQCRGQWRLFTREQRQEWDADQVAIHRAQFETRNGVGAIPF